MSDVDKGAIAMEEVDLLVGGILCVVILTSYIPQHLECLQLRSSQGLSLWTILLSSLSCTFAFLSTLLSDYHSIQASVTTHFDDHNDDKRQQLWLIQLLFILNACMPTIQNAITIVAGTPTYAIYYFYYSQQPQQQNELSVPQQPIDGTKHRFEVTIAVITWLMVTLTVSGSVWVLYIFGSTSTAVIALAKFWGVASAVTNTVQWLPQLDATWTAQHEGILSMWSLIISVISDALVAAYWAFGPGETVWVYMSNATDAILQIILIAMICYFRFRRRGVTANNDHHDQRIETLSRPLLLTMRNTNETGHDNETPVLEQVEIEH